MENKNDFKINYRHLAKVREARSVVDTHYNYKHNKGVRIDWELYGRILEAKAIQLKNS